MYSPKDLEGEVDHSFFDSDCEGSAETSDQQNTHIGDDSIKGGQTCAQVEGEQKEDSSLTVDLKKASDAASPPSCGERSEADRGESEEAPNSSAQVTTESGSSAEEQDEDNEVEEDGYDFSEAEEESEGDWEEMPAGSEVSASCPTRRSGGKFGSHRSPSSSESESSHSESGSCDSEPLSSRRKPTSARFSPRHQLKLAAMMHREKQCPSGESDDTVTDVTPLSTPDSSPIQSFDMAPGGGVDSRGGMKSDLHIDHPGRRVRKNYSFSNEEVRRIDRENQRLLRELSRPTPRPKSVCGSGSGSVSSSSLRKPGSPPVRLYHSALNRQREQQRIERENLAFLKRLESVKPTAGMRRTEQLADYQRQARYLGALPPSTVMDKSSSSRSPTDLSLSTGSSSSRCSASSLRRARPNCSVSPGVPKHRRGTERRAAWS
ncbi:cilia- and flagella-associated protein 97 [Arapaima gigas]